MLLTVQAGAARITLTAATPLPYVFGQPERLKQVFINLLGNAFNYSSMHNVITVTLQNRPDGVPCQITDTGPSIAHSSLPQGED